LQQIVFNKIAKKGRISGINNKSGKTKLKLVIYSKILFLQPY